MRFYGLFMIIGLVGCGSSEEEIIIGTTSTNTSTSTSTTTTTVGQECSTDEECPEGQICESGTCEYGDRDNSFDEASSIFQDFPVMGEINGDGDIDYYSYVSAGEEWLRIQTITEDDGPLDTVVSVYTGGGALHAYMDDFPTGDVTGKDTVLHVYLPHAETWFITVEDQSTFYGKDVLKGGPDSVYELELMSMGATSETDSLKSPSGSISIESDSTIYSLGVLIEEDGDADWITVDLPKSTYDAPMEIWGQADIPGSSVVPKVNLYDPSDELVLSKENLGPGGKAALFNVLPYSYTIEATSTDGAGDESAWFVIYVLIWEPASGAPREEEPNDTDANALGLEVMAEPDWDWSWVQGALNEKGDEDWFSVNIDPDRDSALYCYSETYGSLVDLAVDIQAPDGSIETVLDGPEDSTPFLDPISVKIEGDYLFRVYSEDDAYYGDGAHYRCYVFQYR